MDYYLISPNTKYDTLATALKARQLEHFHYNFDKTNFEQMLKTLEQGAFRDEIEMRLASTCEQMCKVEAIYAALLSQVDDQSALDAAVKRMEK